MFLYVTAFFIGVCTVVLLIFLCCILYNISRNRLVKKENTVRPQAVMLFCSVFLLFFGMLLFRIGIFVAEDRGTFLIMTLASAVCTVISVTVAVLWKSWRLTYDSEGFFFRDYNGRSKEYTYADITAIEDLSLYAGDRRIMRLDSSITGAQEFVKCANINRKKR